MFVGVGTLGMRDKGAMCPQFFACNWVTKCCTAQLINHMSAQDSYSNSLTVVALIHRLLRISLEHVMSVPKGTPPPTKKLKPSKLAFIHVWCMHWWLPSHWILCCYEHTVGVVYAMYTYMYTVHVYMYVYPFSATFWSVHVDSVSDVDPSSHVTAAATVVHTGRNTCIHVRMCIYMYIIHT